MAVTIGSAGITFSDGNSQTSRGAVLSATQYSGYSSSNIGGYQGYTTGNTNQGFAFGNANAQTTDYPQDYTNQMIIGWQAYRSGSGVSNDSANDYGVIQRRYAYRTIS